MPNVLKREKQIAVIATLCEGMAIRQVERMTGVFRDTIMNLGVRVGQGCARIMDEKMRNLNCRNVQVDEIWDSFRRKRRTSNPKTMRDRSETLGRSARLMPTQN